MLATFLQISMVYCFTKDQSFGSCSSSNSEEIFERVQIFTFRQVILALLGQVQHDNMISHENDIIDRNKQDESEQTLSSQKYVMVDQRENEKNPCQ